jgi:hypothetical protein
MVGATHAVVGAANGVVAAPEGLCAVVVVASLCLAAAAVRCDTRSRKAISCSDRTSCAAAPTPPVAAGTPSRAGRLYEATACAPGGKCGRRRLRLNPKGHAGVRLCDAGAGLTSFFFFSIFGDGSVYTAGVAFCCKIN